MEGPLDKTHGPVSTYNTIYTRTAIFPYSIDRNRLTIGAPQSCAANANCTGWEDGTMDSTTARVVSRIFGQETLCSSSCIGSEDPAVAIAPNPRPARPGISA